MTRLRIVSGGQTGVDRAALDAALSQGVSCGGWCPAGRLAEDGPIADSYPLMETTTADYEERTLANVRDSDATLILDCGREVTTGTGTALTAKTASSLGRPVLTVHLDVGRFGAGPLENIIGWIGENDIQVLNIAGPRESECPGIYAVARALILKILAAVGDP